jgi:hypothetical protein
MKNKSIIKKISLSVALFCCSLWIFAQQYPMGYEDETTLSCFREFAPVEFKAKYKWVTYGSPTDPATGLRVPRTMYETRPFDGQTQPLVGDLNGDGKPEIVCLSLDNNGLSSNTDTNEYLYILNGQTGRVILKYRLPSRTHSKGLAYHGTPCQIVLVDADRNGKAEIIVALGAYYGYTNNTIANFKYSKRLVCYEVNDQTFSKEYTATQNPQNDVDLASNKARLTLKWVSDKRYDWNSVRVHNTNLNAVPAYSFTDAEAGGPGKGFTDGGGFCYGSSATTGGGVDALNYFSSPLPQTIALGGSDNIGILVYNKIFSAATGKMLVELENLNPANTTAAYRESNYVTTSQYAFTGRDVNAKNSGGGNGGDTNCSFSTIYDADRDGVMDIACGGKLYYNINVGDPNVLGDETYSVLKNVPGNGLYSSAAAKDYVGDGHTGVADINDDGIEEIVVLHRKPGDSGDSGTILLTAYNPGFYTIVGGQVTPAVGTPTPIVVAQVSIPLSGLGYGNHSTLVIGDLDKLKQDGHKYPEISFMSGDMYANNSDNVPLHPNVAAALRTKLRASAGSNAGKYHINDNSDGQMLSFTYDNTEADVTKRFKVSFIMRHNDNSNNTTFTLFDFDNNGTQDICFRDGDYLRIISPQSPWYVDTNDQPDSGSANYNPMIKFRVSCLSWTGYEGPSIADTDGDGSADIIVMGGIDRDYSTTMFVVEASNTQFAPCPSVWNQFNYRGLRIMQDLKVPHTIFNPLDSAFYYITDRNNPAEREWVYNNTMTQAPIHSLFKVLNPTISNSTGTATDSILTMAPLQKLPDVKVWAKINTTSSPNKFQIYITNSIRASAALNSGYPIAIYAIAPDNIGSISAMTRADVFPVGQAVFPGDTIMIERNIAQNGLSTINANADYIIRVSDANYSQMSPGAYNASTGHPNFQGNGKAWKDDTYLECNWADNWAYTSSFKVADEVFTLQPYDRVQFNVMSNDERPSTCSGILPTFLQTDAEIAAAGSGTRVTTAAGDVTYTAPPTCSDGVIDMSYQLTCSGVTKTAHIYVYLLESLIGEYAACLNTNISVGAKEQPAGTTFRWRNSRTGLEINEPGTFLLNGDTTFYVTPRVPAPYDEIAFPEDTVKVRSIGAGAGVQELLIWEGAAGDGSWNNPGNWVKTSGALAGYSPNECTDVIIPTGATAGKYPKAHKAGSVGKITMQDRAMIANTHLIDYDSASVAVNFTAAERDRWVMYSAPLRKTYTGDFMLRNASEVPLNGLPGSGVSEPAVYMSFFQTANPDSISGTAQARAFTQPFGKLDVPLPLGKSFNIWIDKNVDTGTAFRFPSPLDQYEYWVHYPWGQQGTPQFTGILDRTNSSGVKVSGRFITEDVTPSNSTTGQFTIPGTSPNNNQPGLGDRSGYKYIMAPNPFMAYLDMTEFLKANTTLQNQYKVWNGSDAFISYLGLPHSGGTWWIASSPSGWDAASGSAQYVSPLQSFIVEKKNPNSVVSLTYNPEKMSSTTYSSSDYTLKNAREVSIPEGILYITASRNTVKNSTVLLNAPNASNGYTDEDVTKLFFDNESRPQLSVCTLTPRREALDINLSGDFNNVEIPIGIRTNITGEITLDFSGVEGFGYKVYLRDGNKEVDLRVIPSYKTTIAGNGGDLSKFYEINDRFALKFPAAGNSVESVGSYVRLQTGHGKILLNSDDTMESVEVLSVSGAKVYYSNDKARFTAVDVMPEQVYIVRVATAKGVITRKVMVK